jgi:hypothetical protein
MAKTLEPCPYCGHPVYGRWTQCPYCGRNRGDPYAQNSPAQSAPRENEDSSPEGEPIYWPLFVLVALVVVVLLALLAVAFLGSEIAEWQRDMEPGGQEVSVTVSASAPVFTAAMKLGRPSRGRFSSVDA